MTDLHTENARLRAALRACVNMLDDLVVESGRGIEYGEEDPFRMGEWFDDHDLGNIDTARAILAAPAPDAVQEAARVLLAACPNPLFDRLKPIIMGEVTESIGYTDDVGNERFYKRSVSWTAMKEIIGLALRAIAGDRT